MSGGLGGTDSFFEVARAEVLGRSVGPGDGERVGCPETDRGYGEEDVLAWFEGPGAGEAEGDAHSVTREDFDISISATAANITVDEG